MLRPAGVPAPLGHMVRSDVVRAEMVRSVTWPGLGQLERYTSNVVRPMRRVFAGDLFVAAVT